MSEETTDSHQTEIYRRYLKLQKDNELMMQYCRRKKEEILDEREKNKLLTQEIMTLKLKQGKSEHDTPEIISAQVEAMQQRLQEAEDEALALRMENEKLQRQLNIDKHLQTDSNRKVISKQNDAKSDLKERKAAREIRGMETMRNEERFDLMKKQLEYYKEDYNMLHQEFRNLELQLEQSHAVSAELRRKLVLARAGIRAEHQYQHDDYHRHQKHGGQLHVIVKQKPADRDRRQSPQMQDRVPGGHQPKVIAIVKQPLAQYAHLEKEGRYRLAQDAAAQKYTESNPPPYSTEEIPPPMKTFDDIDKRLEREKGKHETDGDDDNCDVGSELSAKSIHTMQEEGTERYELSQRLVKVDGDGKQVSKTGDDGKSSQARAKMPPIPEKSLKTGMHKSNTEHK